MGLSEILHLIANKYEKGVRSKMLSSVFVSGGGAEISGLGERLKYDIQNGYDEPLSIKIKTT
jgi:actin-related protein